MDRFLWQLSQGQHWAMLFGPKSHVIYCIGKFATVATAHWTHSLSQGVCALSALVWCSMKHLLALHLLLAIKRNSSLLSTHPVRRMSTARSRSPHRPAAAAPRPQPIRVVVSVDVVVENRMSIRDIAESAMRNLHTTFSNDAVGVQGFADGELVVLRQDDHVLPGNVWQTDATFASEALVILDRIVFEQWDFRQPDSKSGFDSCSTNVPGDCRNAAGQQL